MKSKKLEKGRKKQSPSTSSSRSYKVIPTTQFIKEAKRLKKKYPNIGQDFFELQKELKKDPITGNDSLGKSCYKVRMEINDKPGGQSGGARVIVQVRVIGKEVYVLDVYDKSEKSTLFQNELERLLQNAVSNYRIKK